MDHTEYNRRDGEGISMSTLCATVQTRAESLWSLKQTRTKDWIYEDKVAQQMEMEPSEYPLLALSGQSTYKVRHACLQIKIRDTNHFSFN